MGKDNEYPADDDAVLIDSSPEIPLAPELASLAPALEPESWSDWSSAADLSPDIAVDRPTD